MKNVKASADVLKTQVQQSEISLFYFSAADNEPKWNWNLQKQKKTLNQTTMMFAIT